MQAPIVGCFLLLAFVSATVYPNLYSLTSQQKTDIGLDATLKLNGQGPYGSDITDLKLSMLEESQTRFRVRITDANNRRFEVPDVVRTVTPGHSPSTTDYSYSVGDGPFGFKVTRKSTGRTLFSTFPSNENMDGLIYEEQYISFTTSFDDDMSFYGLGERAAPLKLVTTNHDGEIYTTYARDHQTPTHTPRGADNMYGSHPFILAIDGKGDSFGFFLLNSNGMDTVFYPGRIEYRVLGGIIDLFFFTGPTPYDVIKQYSEVIGKPDMPPYWAFGFHMCRWGYGSLAETKYVVGNMSYHRIPQDAQWNDIDYMYRHRDFTLDPETYPEAEVKKFVEELHKNGMKYVMMFDPAIDKNAAPGEYYPLDYGNRLGLWVRNKYGNYFNGRVWPGPTYFPDFSHPDTPKWWADLIIDFHNNHIEFDGLWIDMNEPANFCDGECGVQDGEQGLVAPNREYKEGFDPDHPPYVPGGADLSLHTVTPSALHYGNELHYNLHSLYGHKEMIVTHKATRELYKDKKTLLVTRSSFSGSGMYGTHWLGDNEATWNDLYLSIPGVLAMNIFGLPFVGPDICGFGRDTTKELCTRWMELGAFYPFSRNHNALGQIPQEPYRFGEETIEASRKALNIRYSILPYMYTYAQMTHREGIPFARALAFEFPDDSNTRGIDRQFLLGPGFLVSPVLSEGANQVNLYLPRGRWYDWYTGKEVSQDKIGTYSVWDAPLTHIPLHLRGGVIYPTQQPALTTAESRRNPFELIVALDKDEAAHGSLYWDDGETYEAEEKGQYALIALECKTVSRSGSIQLSIEHSDESFEGLLKKISVYGLSSFEGPVKVNGATWQKYSYDSENHILTIYDLTVNINSKSNIKWGSY